MHESTALGFVVLLEGDMRCQDSLFSLLFFACLLFCPWRRDAGRLMLGGVMLDD